MFLYPNHKEDTHKKLLALAVVLALLSFGLFLTGCSNEETLQTLWVVTENTEGLESLVVLIEYIEEYSETPPGIIEGFSDTTLTATVFVPSNAAFQDLFEI